MLRFIPVIAALLGLVAARPVCGDGDQLILKKRAAQADVLALADRLDAPDGSDRAKRIVDKHDSASISSVFESPIRGGLGVGRLLSDHPHRGIQQLVGRWRSNPPTAEELAMYPRRRLVGGANDPSHGRTCPAPRPARSGAVAFAGME